MSPTSSLPFPIEIAHYRIQCVDRPDVVAEHRRHVTGIGTVERDGTERHWTDISVVRDAITAGHEFYTRYPTSRRDSPVESHDCSCGAETIRSSLDPPAECNLDNLSRCQFR